MERKMNRKLEKVLVVEDHREFREFLEIALTMRGWEVVPSKNGREALEKLRYIRPSLILLDMRMPEMDGFELAQFVKQDPSYRNIPILAVTGQIPLKIESYVWRLAATIAYRSPLG